MQRAVLAIVNPSVTRWHCAKTTPAISCQNAFSASTS